MKIIGKGRVEFGGEKRVYDVVDRSLEGAPRYFICYSNGRPYISDEVPKTFRRHMVFHELFEFEKLQGKSEVGRCMRALMNELDGVPERDHGEYIPFRINVFQNLLDYLEETEPTSPLVVDVRQSLDFLERMALDL